MLEKVMCDPQYSSEEWKKRPSGGRSSETAEVGMEVGCQGQGRFIS